jgi:hypothetical protein
MAGAYDYDQGAVKGIREVSGLECLYVERPHFSCPITC